MIRLPRALFWDIAEHPIYLLATVHAGPAGGFLFPRFADMLIGTTDVAYFEIDPFAPRDMSFMLRPPGSPSILAQDLGPDIYRRLQDENMPLKNPLDQHQAGGIGLLIQATSQPHQPAKYFEDWGVDRVVCQRYYSQKKAVLFLETGAIQGEAAIRGPLNEVVAELESWCRNGRLPRIDEHLVMKAYADGDFAALGVLRAQMSPLRPTMSRAMLQEREGRWVEKIKEIAVSGKSTLIAAGALHFAGDDGLLAQLGKAGFAIRDLGRN
jgi:uncharacterized protein YbaP (TraB family)